MSRRTHHFPEYAMTSDIADIKALLQQRIMGLIEVLCPEGSRAGAYWMARNPTRADTKAGSFWVLISGEPGVWCDEATGDGKKGSANKGDVIGLIAYVNGCSTGEALKWARDWLGLEKLAPGAIAQARGEAVKRDAEQDKMREAELRENQKRAFAVWLKASPSLAGTLVERYLAGRGIDLSLLPRSPGILRYDTAAWHTDAKAKFPCMVAGMSNGAGGILAIHRTWLAADGSGKAPVEHPRKMWPSFAGLVIPLWAGESGLGANEAVKKGVRETLVIVEGVEDGLSVALACPELRVWGAASLHNIANVKLPACISKVVVCADNDWGKPQAAKLLQRGLEALSRQGVEVSVARAHIGKDANDLLRGIAA
jgi:hypothetical protein